MPCLARGNVVARDRVLSHLQCFTPDAAAPMTKILDHLDSGESAYHDILYSLKLLGNTHAHFSAERRQKSLNPDLLHFASEYLFRRRPSISLSLTLLKWQKRGLWLCQSHDRPNQRRTSPSLKRGLPILQEPGLTNIQQFQIPTLCAMQGFHQGYQEYHQGYYQGKGKPPKPQMPNQ